jgi:outer membrane protein assembly factor BamB
VTSFRIVLIAVLFASTLNADDWPQWGGPNRDLIWRETGISYELPEGLLARVWSTPIGEGYSGPAVADGKVFITDAVHPNLDLGETMTVERIHCLDIETGDPLWTHEYECSYTIGYPAGPRATPAYDAGRLYTLGAVGDLYCFEANSGDVIWSSKFDRDFAAPLATWGTAAPPLVDGDQLIVLVGGPDALVVSFNKLTGEENWRALDDSEIGYAPPVIFDVNGIRHLIIWHPRAVSSLDPATGELRWQVPFRVESGLTIATPRLVDNRLLVSSFYNGSRMIEIADDGQSAEVVWKGDSDSELAEGTDGLHCLMCTPCIDDGYIYGVCSYGALRCLDVETGERMWETYDATGYDRWWNGFLIPHEDHVFIHNEQGELIVAKLTPEGYHEISRGLLVEPTRQVNRRLTIWSHPAFAEGSVFARNDREIVRVDLRE